MIKKTFIVLLVALFSQVIASCVNCHCDPPQTISYTHKSISLRNLDMGLPTPKISSSGVISAINYGVNIQVVTDRLSLLKQQFSWGLIQSAYACSCMENTYIPKESVTSIKIFSAYDFDDAHPSGTDLGLYFKAKGNNNNLVGLADYLKSFNDFYHIPQTIFYEGIFLQVPPKNSKRHKFKIAITLSDGRVLTSETTEIELT
ncbi:DUF5034 domain-containing protein [Pedobacter aquatilis]|uniref:DUF5034 domain-containing protein n=1 Tax=Pedobacter aquatilis TaxID=351343 RepID=UPI00292D813A|nr:DUF5034 domain-containing protein [Pedobacter aquatilis]